MLGKAFCLLTLIHSERLYEDGGECIRQVVEQFLKLAKERSYLPQLCMNGISQIIAEVTHSIFLSQLLLKIFCRTIIFVDLWLS